MAEGVRGMASGRGEGKGRMAVGGGAARQWGGRIGWQGARQWGGRAGWQWGEEHDGMGQVSLGARWHGQ